MEKLGIERELALKVARAAGKHIATIDDKAAEKGIEKVKTLVFLSPNELDSIAAKLAEAAKTSPDAFAEEEEAEEKKKKKDKGGPDLRKIISKACGEIGLKDAADIALFGRMVASDHSLTVEGAAMFSHAISTHKADNDLDFYTAVDDRQKDDPTIEEEDRTGSGMMGTIEFSSAVYYRYVAVNLDLLADKAHLAGMSVDERRQVVDTFIRSALMAVPGARKNSMNAHTLPGYVLGTYKSKGQPVQLVNAFESPVRAKGGLLDASVEALKAEHAKLKETWGLVCDTEVAIPDTNLNAFCEALKKHVA
jgi:CRISPR system Cascade subunit CasC